MDPVSALLLVGILITSGAIGGGLYYVGRTTYENHKYENSLITTTAAPSTLATNLCIHTTTSGKVKFVVSGFGLSEEHKKLCNGPCREVYRLMGDWKESANETEKLCGCSRWIDFSYDVDYDSPWPVGTVSRTFHARVHVYDEGPVWQKTGYSHFGVDKKVMGISNRSAIVVHPGGPAFRLTVSELKKRRAAYYDEMATERNPYSKPNIRVYKLFGVTFNFTVVVEKLVHNHTKIC